MDPLLATFVAAQGVLLYFFVRLAWVARRRHLLIAYHFDPIRPWYRADLPAPGFDETYGTHNAWLYTHALVWDFEKLSGVPLADARDSMNRRNQRGGITW